MKLTILQENLIKGLNIVGRSVATRPQLPILANILLSAEEGRLRMAATNLEMGVNFWAGAKIEKEGSFTVPARAFLEFVSSLPKEKVEVSLEEGQLVVKCGSYEASFNGIAATEFPSLPSFPEEALFTLKKEILTEALQKVSFAAATDEGRPVLTGVLFKFLGKDLFLVATDGFRLSVFKIPNPLPKTKEETKILLPARALAEVIKATSGEGGEKSAGKLGKSKEEKGEMEFALLPHGNQAIFSADSTEIVTQLIGGEFPNYEKIIPAEGGTKITVLGEELLRAVRMAAIFARDSANIVRFKIENERLSVSANAAQVGKNKSELAVRGSGEGEIAFNSKYLLDFLNVAGEKEVSLEMTSPLSPGVFKIVGEEEYLHIIMPVRVQA